MCANASQRSNQNGLQYFLEGFRLMMRPGMKRFVFMPILVNIIILGGAFSWLYLQVDGWIEYLLTHLPSWLQWLKYLMWPMVLASILLIFGYFFSALANIIAAPFNSFLAEKVESELRGIPAESMPWSDVIKDIPRTLQREWTRIKYYIPRALLILIISFVPVINVAAPFLWFIFGAWMLTLQYCDYAFDNHKISFPVMLTSLKQDRITNIPFGGLVYIATMVPILNLFIMPASVCAGTALWVDRYRQKHLPQ